MRRLRFTVQALQDFQDIHDYIAKDNVDIALEFIERLEERCNELIEMPGMGRKRDELAPGMRSSGVGDYLIFYRVDKEDLEIMHVLHGRRDLPEIFGKD
ncbi:MAG: type II toxin-antitoxin system RelE/ParE family toxin [Terriglobales bacterium]